MKGQNVSIGTATANNSALLHLESTTKGLLPPRMSNSQMQAISLPATGDLVYNNTYSNYYYYTGSYWAPLAGSGWSLTGDAGTSPSTNFLGTIDSVDLVQKTKVVEHIRFFAAGNIGLTNVNNVAEQLRFYEPSGSGSNYTSLQADIQSGNVHYVLPLGDGSPNAALITDGAGNLSWHVYASLGGGGSVTLWNRGSGKRTLEGDGSGNQASGQYALAAGINSKASGQECMIWGNSNDGTGNHATVSGGETNQASGDYSTIAGGLNIQVSGNHGYCGGGKDNSVSGAYGVILGGINNALSGSESVIINGSSNSVSGNDNVVFGYSIALAGSDQDIFFPPGPTQTRLGIGTSGNPTEAGDIVGNVKFSGALKPNNSGGTSGQFLKSAGTNTPPTWGTISLPSTNWGLTGTFSSTPPTNFIGTTDAQDLVVRTSATERVRIASGGFVGINASTSTHQLASAYSGTGTETAAIYGIANGSSTVQAIGLWGRADNTSSSNTGTVSLLGTGNGNTTSGQTNIALQLSDGEFAMGRTTESSSAGSVVEGAATGTLYSAQGPSGVIQLSLTTDLTASAPTSGVYQDLGAVTINNRYITASSIILANIISKIDGGGNPSPKNAVYKIDVQSRTAGSCVVRIGMIPFVTDSNPFQGSDYIRLGYVIINSGR